MANGDYNSSTVNPRSITTTTVKYLKKVESEVLRSRAISRKVMESGNIVYNVDGLGMQWEVEYKLTPSSGYNGEDPRTFSRNPFIKTASLPLDRGLIATDQITIAERRANKGGSALVRVADTMVNRMMKGIKEGWARQFFNDGGTAGSQLPMGLETFLAINGDGTASTVTITDGTERNSNAADKYGWPDDTYATLTTGLGDYGGAAISGVWPFGEHDPEYDFWSPLVLNYTSTAYTGSAATWAEQGPEVVREMLINANRNAVEADMIDLVLVDRTMLGQFWNKLGPSERVMVTSKDPGTRSYGFQTVVYDGAEITTDYGVPANVGYGLSLGNVEYHSTGPEVFTVDGPADGTYDIDTGSWKWAIFSLGNLKFRSPRHFAKLAAVA